MKTIGVWLFAPTPRPVLKAKGEISSWQSAFTEHKRATAEGPPLPWKRLASYSVNHVDLKAGEHKTAAFLVLNPRGLVPVMAEEGQTRAELVLTQSNAIIFYAASRSLERLIPDPGQEAALFSTAWSISSPK